MDKLGVQILAWMPGSIEFCLRSKAKYIKVLDPNPEMLHTLKTEIPDCFIDYRRYMEGTAQAELLTDPIAGARRFRDAILRESEGARPFIDAYEGPNEMGLWNGADTYNLFTAEYARLMHQEGCKVIAYNFPVGNPSGYFNGDGNQHPDEFREGLRAYWAHYLDGLRESDYLGLHEYSAPKMQSDAGWLMLRYRRVWDILPADCRKPILLTEVGIDGGVIGRAVEICGWRAFDYSEEQYLEQLRWFNDEIAKDAYVFGAHIYHCGSADPRWESFNIVGCDRIADYMVSQREEESMPNRITDDIDQWFDSPNYTPGRPVRIDRIVIHSTRGGAPIGREAEGTVTWFLMPSSKDSAHALLTQAGQRIHFVADENQAWGAGEELNQRGLHVELEQPDNDTPFTPIQMQRLAETILWWSGLWNIPLDDEHVVAHSETQQGKEEGKSDPGTLFSWALLWQLLGVGQEPGPEPDPRAVLIDEIIADLAAVSAKVERLRD